MKQKITLLAWCLMGLFFVLSAEEKAPTNLIHLGQAEISVAVEGCDTDSLNLWVETSPLFSGFYENDVFGMEKIRKGLFEGAVELEQEEEIVVVYLKNEYISFGVPIVASQARPTKLRVTVSSDGEIENVEADYEGPTQQELISMGGMWMDAFGEYIQVQAPDDMYNDWSKVQNFFLERLKFALYNIDYNKVPDSYKEWFANSVALYFISRYYIPYKKHASAANGLEVEEPPMEAYSALNSLDYSPNMLKHFPFVGVKPFLSTILRFAGGGFRPIGDKPVNEWEKYAAEKLAPAIEKPTPLLLNLLSAMSYILQIENERKPLNPVQMQNVKKGYGDDLDKIILSYNKRLEDELKKVNPEMQIDLTNETFSLKQFIDSKFPGKPVIVDTWNTWCAPCLNAMQQISTFKNELPKDVVYLYICDTSSVPEEIVKMTAKISGYNVQISKQDSDNLGLEYNLEGFPSYLFFNADHSLRASMTGFPGLIRFKALAEELSATIAD